MEDVMKGFVSSGWALVLGALALGGCSSTTTASDSSYEGASRGEGGGSSGGMNAGTAAPSGDGTGGTSSSGSTTGTGVPGGPQSGTLTAGVWDDTLNFDFFKKYYDANTYGRIFTWLEHDAAKLRAVQSPKQQLDVGVVFDTTGSMGDELRYLQSEMDSIATTLNQKFPGVQPRFGLVVYRDASDMYTTQTFDFTTDLGAFKAKLNSQSAAGGGDIPEAVPEGLAAGVALSWRADPSVARLMFFVADAPQHSGTEPQVKAALDGAVQKGIKVFPVAASGTNPAAELTMREAAQYTGGRYIFLTDDSGVGNPHAEPHIPCYNVTRLDKAIVRMAESEMAGARIEPVATEVIRTVGDPKDGKCTMKDSTQVILY